MKWRHEPAPQSFPWNLLMKPKKLENERNKAPLTDQAVITALEHRGDLLLWMKQSWVWWFDEEMICMHRLSPAGRVLHVFIKCSVGRTKQQILSQSEPTVTNGSRLFSAHYVTVSFPNMTLGCITYFINKIYSQVVSCSCLTLDAHSTAEFTGRKPETRF